MFDPTQYLEGWFLYALLEMSQRYGVSGPISHNIEVSIRYRLPILHRKFSTWYRHENITHYQPSGTRGHHSPPAGPQQLQCCQSKNMLDTKLVMNFGQWAQIRFFDPKSPNQGNLDMQSQNFSFFFFAYLALRTTFSTICF